ncbi:MAG: DUF1476 domain-containing protein [Acetobacteraceae bacterium]|nr:DUF1476 domain-containing protein [Acetobacteraceae bacterium]
MPITLHDREQAFEAKFVHDEEFRFLVGARRDKLFARWAAAKLGLSDHQHDELVNAVLTIRDGPGHDPAVLKLIADRLAAGGAETPESELAEALQLCGQQARQQLTESRPDYSG